jgi:DNA-binding winged helix-turn-helix (wHTH) protein
MPLYRFAVFEFNSATGDLRRTGRPVDHVRLRPQPARALHYLLERHGEFVSRGELQRVIWPDGTFVHFDYGLNSCIKQIRTALGDSRSAPSYVETLVKRGFRFIAPVSVVGASSPDSELSIVAAPSERVEHRRRKGVVVNALCLSLCVVIPASVAILANSGGHSQQPPGQEHRATARQEKLLQSDLVAVPGTSDGAAPGAPRRLGRGRALSHQRRPRVRARRRVYGRCRGSRAQVIRARDGVAHDREHRHDGAKPEHDAVDPIDPVPGRRERRTTDDSGEVRAATAMTWRQLTRSTRYGAITPQPETRSRRDRRRGTE